MSAQLHAIIDEFDSAQRRLHALARRVSVEHWTIRPDPTRWSVAECVGHLNLTSAAFLPILDEALERARQLPRSPRSYRHDVPGWLLWRVMGPPVRFRAKAAAAFVPPAEILARPLDFRIRSIATGAGDPPAPPARHLWQAERAADEIVSPTGHS